MGFIFMLNRKDTGKLNNTLELCLRNWNEVQFTCSNTVRIKFHTEDCVRYFQV